MFKQNTKVNKSAKNCSIFLKMRVAALFASSSRVRTWNCKLANLQKKESMEFNWNVCKKKFLENVRRRTANFWQYFHSATYLINLFANDELKMTFRLKILYFWFSYKHFVIRICLKINSEEDKSKSFITGLYIQRVLHLYLMVCIQCMFIKFSSIAYDFNVVLSHSWEVLRVSNTFSSRVGPLSNPTVDNVAQDILETFRRESGHNFYSSPRSVIVWNSDSKLGMNNVAPHRQTYSIRRNVLL